jgi:protein-tyrosine phosphatase
MAEEYPRVIPFENIKNFRDLGGYKAGSGKTVAWRRLYRSGDPMVMSAADKTRLKNDIKIKTVIDLKSPGDTEKIRIIRVLEELGIKYFNLPFRPDDPEYYKQELEYYRTLGNLGETYMRRISYDSFGRRLIQMLEVIADPAYHPLVFHCGVGKDRTGMLAAILLNVLNVSDKDIIIDYAITDAFMDEIRERIISAPETTEEIKTLPDFTWRAEPGTMSLFLSLFKKEYGSAAGYLKKHGADKTLVRRLEKALLV